MIVENFGIYWDKGVVDPALEGNWQNSDGECMQYIKANNHYAIKNENITIKTLPLKNSTYMMMKEPKSHSLYKYTIDDNKLTLYGPNKNNKEEYLKQYSNPNIELDDYTVTITTLDTSVIDLLGEIGNQPNFWKTQMIFTKQTQPCPIEPQSTSVQEPQSQATQE